MIAYLKGAILRKGADSAVVDVNGLGYEVFLTPSSLQRLHNGDPVELFITESFGLYGGGAALYGFLNEEEQAIFESFKAMPKTGAKKSLEYLEKAAKSLPDFRRAVLEKDFHVLVGIFGFTKKTAEKLVLSLKDKLAPIALSGERLYPGGAAARKESQMVQQAVNALTALGYKNSEAKTAIQTLTEERPMSELSLEECVRLALKKL
ncbi:MAG: hypothetical protein A3G41_09035 [Elusimicrobia bacterium RIFCSPLOWO2_12_FULL_59_9]|nr:MAG: hypothetical protein A3G41_09035 [Elusimicrobia bacterium RIFCSPLOWO2_12_FULL_59_9]